jgi:hypothetical protein
METKPPRERRSLQAGKKLGPGTGSAREEALASEEKRKQGQLGHLQ